MTPADPVTPVLVVDDSPVARKLVEQALPRNRFSILAAKTGHEALELFERHRPGLVITPDLSGIELCQRLRRDFPDSFAYMDKFKSVNNTFGHDAGDAGLRRFADVFKATSRTSDICGRLGGDEFLLVLTYTDRTGVQAAVERIREQIYSKLRLRGVSPRQADRSGRADQRGRRCTVRCETTVPQPI